MHDDGSLPDRKRIVSDQHRSYHAHELVEVAEHIPGDEPTDVEASLSDGPTYETTYWRCRRCGEERSHWSGFIDDCRAASVTPPRPDGGSFDPSSIPQRVLKRAQYEQFEFSWLEGNVHVRNESHANPSDHEYVVRIEDGEPTSCTCPADSTYDGPCKHRVAVAIRRAMLEFVSSAC